MKNSALMAAAVLLIPAASLTLSSCSTPPPAPEATSEVTFVEGVAGGVAVTTIDVRAKVTAINASKREVTLMGSDGEKFTVQAGPEAVNFDQVRVGDMVHAEITQELVVWVDDEDAPAVEGSAAMVALAPEGGQPGGVVAGTALVKAEVVAIDPAKQTTTVRFADGTTQTLPVRDDVDLTQHQVGETVVFRVTNMVAINIEKQ